MCRPPHQPPSSPLSSPFASLASCLFVSCCLSFFFLSRNLFLSISPSLFFSFSLSLSFFLSLSLFIACLHGFVSLVPPSHSYLFSFCSHSPCRSYRFMIWSKRVLVYLSRSRLEGKSKGLGLRLGCWVRFNFLPQGEKHVIRY
jgi:hypothetical protein